MKFGFRFFFAKNYGLNSFKEQVDLYEPEEEILTLDKEFLNHRKYSIYLSKILNYYIIKSSWKFNKYIKRFSFTKKLFKLRFMTGFYYPLRQWKSSKNYLDQRFFTK